VVLLWLGWPGGGGVARKQLGGSPGNHMSVKRGHMHAYGWLSASQTVRCVNPVAPRAGGCASKGLFILSRG
jgi:hypothetical protein